MSDSKKVRDWTENNNGQMSWAVEVMSACQPIFTPGQGRAQYSCQYYYFVNPVDFDNFAQTRIL